MPGGRGRKKNHKGGRRQFTNPDEVDQAAAKAEKEKEWKRRQGLMPDSNSEDEGEDGEKPVAKPKEEDDGIQFASESSSEESEEEEEAKPKGVAGLIEIENPNRAVKKVKKVTDLDTSAASSKTQLSRREREEIEKQQAKDRYQKMHMEGKTDEARADLARLTLIRKQREEAAKKKAVEKDERDKAAKAAADKLKEKRKH